MNRRILHQSVWQLLWWSTYFFISYLPACKYFFNHHIETRYLASSGEPVYKVVSPERSCPSANSTCTPEVWVKIWTAIGVVNETLLYYEPYPLVPVLQDSSVCRKDVVYWGKQHFFFLCQIFNRSDISKYELCQGSQCLFAFYGGETSYHRYVFWLQLSNLLLFFWLVNFSLALEQCSLAGAFASYYWASKKPCDIPSCPLFLSFFRAIRSGHNCHNLLKIALSLLHVASSVVNIHRLSSDITQDLWHLGL